jgi:hypothetical protein
VGPIRQVSRFAMPDAEAPTGRALRYKGSAPGEWRPSTRHQ